jgi:hypothetical protein
MRSEDEESPLNEQQLYEFLDEALSEPILPAPPGIEERYRAMIRAHFSAPTVQLPGWHATSLLAGCVTVVLVVLTGAAFSPIFAAGTMVCAAAYAGLLRTLARWEAPRPV